MKQFIKQLKLIPRWGWIAGIIWFFSGFGIYRLGMWLSKVFGTISRAFSCKIPCIDDHIPVIPVFIVIYLLSYVFWVIGYAFIARTGKKNFINFLFASGLAYLTGFLFFIFLPTCIDRTAEGLIALSERPGLFNWMLHVTYFGDGGTTGFNLFPSFHCISSAFCYLYLRKQEQIPKSIEISALIGNILIYCSTVFTKQHYFIDVAGGVVIAVFWYLIVKAIDPAKHFS